MRFDINRAIKIMFSEENKGKILKLALAFMLVFLPLIVIFEIAMPGFSGGYNYTYQYSDNEVNVEFMENNMILFFGTVIYTVVASIVFSIYQYGYYINTFRSIQAGNYKLPEVDFSHFGPGLKTFLYYLVMMLVIFGLMCVFVLALGIVAVPYGMLMGALSEGLQIVAGIVGVIFMIIAFILAYILMAFLMIASLYIFGVTNSIGKAISIKRMFQATKIYWKSFLMIFLFSIALSIALNIVVVPIAMIPYLGSAVIYAGSFLLGFILYIAVFDSLRSIDLVKAGVLNAEDLCITPVASGNTTPVEPAVEVVK